MDSRIRLCINTQTPPVRFKIGHAGLMEKYGEPFDDVKLSDLEQGVDFDLTPGGVTSMMRPVVERMYGIGLIDKPYWIALGPEAPKQVAMDNMTLLNISLEPELLRRYTNFKEGIWNEIHGLSKLNFEPDDYEAYVSYNWSCAKLMLERLKDIDLFWIHDFQQLHIGNLIGPSAPAILRWHIPFNLENVSSRLRTLVLKSIEGFDAMVVSTKRDLEGLIHAGYRGRAYALYPYLDPSIWNKVSPAKIESTKEKFKIQKDDIVLLVVGRMDPVKSQDVAIKALGIVNKQFPNAKMILTGNGSFTGSGKGGLGHPKAARWRTKLESLVHMLKLEQNVIFTGHVSQEELDAVYSFADVVLTPSNIEGFNLTAIEGWIHAKPCIVSRGAGVSELVHDNLNGFVFNPGDENDLASKLESLLASSELRVNLGSNGSKMSEQCFVDVAIKSLQQLFEDTSKAYSKSNVAWKNQAAPSFMRA